MTDLVQGVFLLGVGLAIVILAAIHVGGAAELWAAFPETHRSALPAFNTPPKYNFIGGFWNDAMIGGVAFYFFNQGMMLRFLSARSVDEGRKAVAAVILILMPLTAVAVASAGWVGQAMTHVMGPDGVPLIDPLTEPKAVFTVVTKLLFTLPGSYGLVIAALVAALMSTVDTLINASAAIVVNDILRPLRPNNTEAQYLRDARFASIAVCVTGLLLVPAYNSFDSLYEANAFLKAAIPPPVAVAVLLGAFWKRSTTAGVSTAMITAITLTSLSFVWPQLVEPFAHGTPWDPDGNPAKQLIYMRAFFSFSIALIVGIVVSLATTPKSEEELEGLVASDISKARERFKGGPVRQRSPSPETTQLGIQQQELGFDDGGRPLALLGADLLKKLDIAPGDLLFAEHPNPIWGGLRSGCFRVHPDSGSKGTSGLLIDNESSGLLGSKSGDTVKIWRWM
jgi:SSS family solute:Na+ symporter